MKIKRIINLFGKDLKIFTRDGKIKRVYKKEEGRYSLLFGNCNSWFDEDDDISIDEGADIEANDICLETTRDVVVAYRGDRKSDPFPEPEEGIFYIVPEYHARALKRSGRSTDDLFIPHNIVWMDGPRFPEKTFLGCEGLKII